MKEWHDGTSQSRIQGKSNETKQNRGCVIYLFVSQILTELLFCARHCASDWVRSEQRHRPSWGLLRRRDKKHPLGKYLSVKHKEENEKEVDRRHLVGGGDHKLTTKWSIKKWHWMKTKEGKEVAREELGKGISNRGNGKNTAQRSSKETSEARTRVWSRGGRERINKGPGHSRLHENCRDQDFFSEWSRKLGSDTIWLTFEQNHPGWFVRQRSGASGELVNQPWYEVVAAWTDGGGGWRKDNPRDTLKCAHGREVGCERGGRIQRTPRFWPEQLKCEVVICWEKEARGS